MILTIDLETYSTVDLFSCGLYAYSESAQILLLGYAFDDEPVQVVEVAQGEQIPRETLDDFKAFERLMKRILSLPTDRNVSLRIKWTPFIPQPCTPLGDAQTQYCFDMVDRINVWHALHKYPRREPGFWVTNDGLMTRRSHQLQCRLTVGNERLLLGKRDVKPLHTHF